MPLETNSRLGPYEIKSAIGTGGMGEVYRARDTRLNRDVAIKVLRQDGAPGSTLHNRFEREAKALAALSHPNVVAVYDFGFEDGQPYIVSELVEGTTLRSLLDRKPNPPRRIVEIGTQLAEGLAAAHAAGIVHRDLKPENIMVGRDGRIKILDFGLARQSSANSGETATLSIESARHITSDGAVVGTASYMSPEQAAGKPVDYRTDQFSLALILYELASGRQPFARGTAVETMAAIVRDDPPPIEERLPAPLRWIMERCLAKEPEQRYESTRDLARDLGSLRDHFSDAVSSVPGSTEPSPVAEPKRPGRWSRPGLAVAAGLIFGGLMLGALLVWIFKPVGQRIGNYRYTPFAANAFGASWSPDGKAVAYSIDVNHVSQVFLRYLDLPIPIQLTHEPRGVRPVGFLSDRNRVVIFQQTAARSEAALGKLISVPVVGGEPDFVMNAACDTCDVSRDGKTYAQLSPGTSNGGEPWSVYLSDPIGSPLRPYLPAPFATHEVYNAPMLRFSPDGKKILLIIDGERNKRSAWILPLPAGSGTPHEVLRHLPALGPWPNFSWFPDSRHIVIALATTQDTPQHLWIADTESDALEPLTTGNADEDSPALSPDGKMLLYGEGSESYDLVSVSLADGTATTIESTGREEEMPAWSPGKDELAWVSDRSGPYEIWLRSGDGSERPVVTAAQFPDGNNRLLMDPLLSPDGKTLVFTRIAKDGICRLWIMALAGGAPVRLTNAEPDGEYGGAWSPDGAHFVYLQVAKGEYSVMTVRAGGSATPVAVAKIPQGLWMLPAWSPNGEWITLRDASGWHLISPDGKTSKPLGDLPTPDLAFSKDGKLLYGIQTAAHADEVNPGGGNRAILFSIDPVTLQQKVIRDLGRDMTPSTSLVPGIRLSLAPDGKSITYSTGKGRSDLWMLQGYRLPGRGPIF